jgi:hypothetical protein
LFQAVALQFQLRFLSDVVELRHQLLLVVKRDHTARIHVKLMSRTEASVCKLASVALKINRQLRQKQKSETEASPDHCSEIY